LEVAEFTEESAAEIYILSNVPVLQGLEPPTPNVVLQHTISSEL